MTPQSPTEVASATPAIEDRPNAPRGFGPAPVCPEDWLPPGDGLRLPLAHEGATHQSVASSWEGAEPPAFGQVSIWPESFGALEPRLAEFGALLPEGAPLLLSLRNTMAPTNVRSSLEGRRSGFDPAPALPDRETSFDLRRVVRALTAAGFVVEDVVEVRGWEAELPRASVEALLRTGIAATRHLISVPPERFWIRTRRTRPLSGSALVAGTRGDLARTRAALAACLPPDWEVVVGPERDASHKSWNDALPESRGDLCWLLRPGDEPSVEDFARLHAAALASPAIPTDPEGVTRHGIVGVMLERASFFDIGPIPNEIESSVIAGEEWVMRGAAIHCPFEQVSLDGPWRGPDLCALEGDPSAARGLLDRWAMVNDLPEPGDRSDRLPPTPPWVAEGREPRISLCMITKDEESFLAGSLDRVRDVVDEIIVVDTGSSDRTVEIAESFGAKVLSMEWVDDFSAARNRGLAHATGDWILVLDADEFVEYDSLPVLRDAARVDNASGFHITFKNDFEEGRTHGVTMTRMFRNLPGIRFRYRIHEQVVPSLVAIAEPMHLGLQPLDVTVIHYGYSPKLLEERGKHERNKLLFRKQIEEAPDDLYCLYKYGDFLRMRGGNEEEVIAILRRAMAILRRREPEKFLETPFAGEIAALLGLELARAGKAEEADEVLREGLRRFMVTPNLYYIAAVVASGQGRHDEALEHFRRCLDYRGRVMIVPIQEGLTSWVAYTGIASCSIGKGDTTRARGFLDLAIRENPEWEVSALILAGLELMEGDATRALGVLEAFSKRKESAVVRLQGGLILSEMGRVEDALDWLDAAADLGGVSSQGHIAVLASAFEGCASHDLAQRAKAVILRLSGRSEPRTDETRELVRA